MATWQQGINSGGFLAGIGAQNENAPKASDINATLGLIRENNELSRSGANNVSLTALRGLAGVADIYKQEQQQKAIRAFNKVHADAWASGDPSGLFKFAQENPAFVAQAQQAFSGLNDQQRNDMGDLAMRANVALSQGPEAYSKFITDNKDRLNRVGANADWMIQTGIQNPELLSHMLTTMSLGALGPEKAFAVQDKMAGREIDRGRLAETIRSNQAGEALQARG
ncbi:DNA transfer protein, partial [Escherichia coli]